MGGTCPHPAMKRNRSAEAIAVQGKGCHAAGAHPENLVEVGGAAERKARCRQPRRELFEVDTALLEHDSEPEPAFLVFQEKALAVTSRKAAAQCRRLGDGEDRRM